MYRIYGLINVKNFNEALLAYMTKGAFIFEVCRNFFRRSFGMRNQKRLFAAILTVLFVLEVTLSTGGLVVGHQEVFAQLGNSISLTVPMHPYEDNIGVTVAVVGNVNNVINPSEKIEVAFKIVENEVSDIMENQRGIVPDIAYEFQARELPRTVGLDSEDLSELRTFLKRGQKYSYKVFVYYTVNGEWTNDLLTSSVATFTAFTNVGLASGLDGDDDSVGNTYVYVTPTPSLVELKPTVIPSGVIPSDSNNDVDKYQDILGHWARKYINEIIERGIAVGYADGTFRPGADINREEMVVMIVKAAGFELSADVALDFNDYSSISDFAKPFIKVALDNGIISGYPNGNFGSKDYVTREQTTVMLMKAFDFAELEGGASPFNDSRDIRDWSRGYVDRAVDLGIISGYNEKGIVTFRPQKNVSRAEATTMIYKCLAKIEN